MTEEEGRTWARDIYRPYAATKMLDRYIRQEGTVVICRQSSRSGGEDGSDESQMPGQQAT